MRIPPLQQIGKTQRKSNIELLRVLAMLMILVLHTRFDGIESVYEYEGLFDASLFLCFVKMDIGYKKWINWLAASSFAVLLFHVAPFAKYNQVNELLYNSCSGITYIAVTGIIIAAYYLAGLLIDQIRILIFRKIIK